MISPRCIFFLVILWSLTKLLSAQDYQDIIKASETIQTASKKIAYLDSVIESRQWSKYPDTVAMLYFNKSQILFRENISISEALKALDDGLELITEHDHRLLWIKMWLYKGYWYRKWDKYEEAKQSLTQALKYQDDNPYVYEATIQLGKTYKDRGEFSLALELYLQAIQLAGNDNWKLANANEVTAFVYLIMDTKEGAKQAIAWLNKLLTLLKSMEDTEHYIASMTYNLGTAYLTLEDYAAAKPLFDKAEAMNKKCCNDPDFISLLYESRASLLSAENKYDQALAMMFKSLEYYQHSFDLTRSDGLASSFNSIADLYLKNKNYPKALEYIQKAISYRLAGIDNEEEYVYYINDALLRENGEKHYLIDELLTHSNILQLLYQDKNELSYLLLSKEVLLYADRLVDLMRFEHIENSTKIFWRNKTREVYQNLVKVLFQLNECEEAFYYAEKSKYLLMGEHLVKNEKLQSQSQLSANIQAYRAVRIDIEKTEVIIKNILRDKNLDAQDSLGKKLIELKREEDDLLSLIKLLDRDYYEENISFKIIDIATIRRDLISADQTWVEYFVGDTTIYTFVITNQVFDCIISPNDHKLSTLVSQLRESIISSYRNSRAQLNIYANTGYELYKILIQPIEHLMSDNVIVVYDPILAHIPLALLLSKPIEVHQSVNKLKNWPFLMHQYNISYQKSASLAWLSKSTQKKSYSKKDVLAIAPDYGFIDNNYAYATTDITREAFMGSLPPLSGTTEEISFIQSKMQGNYLVGESATESSFRAALHDAYRICHIAGHAIVDAENPDNSRLLLEKDNHHDGDLYSYEIAMMDIKADLLILSACNTGIGKTIEGEGIASLATAFAQAGSPNILMSLWPVSDKATSSLIKEYYKQILNGLSKRDALREAQKDFLKNVEAAYHHPYFWGGFVYYGDNDTIGINAPSSWPKVNILLVGLFVFVGLMILKGKIL